VRKANFEVDQEKEAEKARKSEEKSAKKEEARLAKEKRKSAKRESIGTEPAAAAAAATAVPDSGVEPEEQVAVQPIEAEGEPLATAAVATEPAITETTTANIIATEPMTMEPVVSQPIISEPVISRPIPTEPSATTGAGTGLLAIGDNPPRAAPQPPVAQESESVPMRTSMENETSLRMRNIAARASADEVPNRKVKSWFKNRFSRRLSRGAEKPIEKEKEKEEGFVGGAALAGDGANKSTASLDQPSSVRDVALAGKVKDEAPTTEPGELAVGSSDHRMVEEDLERQLRKGTPPTDDEFQEARDRFDESLAAPPTFPAVKEASPVRDSKFIEEI
jgi:hypothetical protein